MIDEFLSAEEEYGLLEDNINGFNYWFFIRDKIYHKLIGSINQSDAIGIFSRFYRKIDKIAGSNYLITAGSKLEIKTIVHMLKNILFPQYLTPQVSDILIFPSARRVMEKGLYYSIYTDYLQDLFPGRCSTAEFAEGLMHLRPAYSQPIYEMDRLDILPFVKGELSKIFNRSMKKIFMEKGIYISKMLHEKLGKRMDPVVISNMIETRYYWYKYKKRALEKFILKTDPKIIVEVCGYGRNVLLVNEIADKLNIPTVEFQHGNMGFGHIGYNYKVKRSYPNLPKYMCVFGEYWKKTMRFPVDKSVVVTGFPFWERERARYANHQTKYSIIVFSQPIYTNELIDLTKFISVHLGNDYSIYFKLHPAEFNHSVNIVAEFLNYTNVTVVDGEGRHLYDLFSECQIQVGVFTTCLFEGIGCGLKTILINIRDSVKRVEDLIAGGYAVLASDEMDCVRLIKADQDLNMTTKKVNDFFVEDSVNKTKQFIASLLEN